MSAKIIDSRRYKTITKTQLDKKRKKIDKELKSPKKSYHKSNKSSFASESSNFVTNLRIKKHRERKLEREMLLYSRPQRTVIKEPKQKIYIPKPFIITCCVIVAILLIYVSAKIMKFDEKISVNVFSNNDDTQNTDVKLEANYNMKIGLTSFNNKDVYTSNNLILNDLYKNSSLSLVKVKKNYEINYQVAKSITKNSNAEYIINLNDKYKLDSQDILYSINKIKEAGNSSVYYDRIKNIKSIENDNEALKITLNEDDPYFIYTLDFPIIDDESKVYGKYVYSIDNDIATFKKAPKNENNNINSIEIKNYSNINEIVNDFASDKLDVFFASSNNDMQLIGKKEYNVKKYKDGETLFIFGNKNSNIFSKKEVRTSLMYSLNREEIVKNSDNNFIEIIDLPYLYSAIKYKYDIVGSNNLMTANDWNKNVNGIYEKYENGNYYSATLRLLVNEQDTVKINVANNIKNMAQNAGINIQIETTSTENIEQKINSGDYDLVLASVYLNEMPNVEFLRNYLDINDKTSQAFKQVEQSSCEELPSNIQNLEYVLSDEVACIGIYARNINLVYQKYIYGFDDLNYMNIFNNFERLGKIVE